MALLYCEHLATQRDLERQEQKISTIPVPIPFPKPDSFRKLSFFYGMGILGIFADDNKAMLLPSTHATALILLSLSPLTVII